jgi:hypothetical protein
MIGTPASCIAVREEAVTGMNRLGARALSGVEDPLDREVALGRGRWADEERLVRIGDVERGPVALGVDTDRADAELAEGPEDADRDLPSVGDENLLEHERAVFSPCRDRRRPAHRRACRIGPARGRALRLELLRPRLLGDSGLLRRDDHRLARREARP